MPNNILSHYRQSQLSSMTPEKTVLMLYDGAISFLKSAVSATSEKNIAAKAGYIEKALKILEYLQSCLDKEKGGEIAENLDRLYDYISITLTKANLKNDLHKMDEAIQLLQTVREGWKSICHQGDAQNNAIKAASQSISGDGQHSSLNEHKPSRSLGIRV